MNKLVNPLPDGGFPLETEDLLLWQTQVYAAMDTAFNAVSTSAFVINGCAVSNIDTQASTLTIGFGWVRIAGEVRIFGGYSGTYPVYLTAKAPQYDQKQFFDGSVQNAYVDSLTLATTAQPSSGDYITFNPQTTTRYQDLLLAPATTALATEVTIRGNAITNLQNQVTALQNETKAPIGSIMMWASPNIPAGWGICDGTQVITGTPPVAGITTPDLRGKFIVAVDTRRSDYFLGQTGGEDFHTLTIGEMPSHDHTTTANYFNQGTTSYPGGGQSGDKSVKWNNGSFLTGQVGSNGYNQPHENRPSFYSLYYIQRLY